MCNNVVGENVVMSVVFFAFMLNFRRLGLWELRFCYFIIPETIFYIGLKIGEEIARISRQKWP